MQKLKFVLVMPLLALLLVCCSLGGVKETRQSRWGQAVTNQSSSHLRIGKITWMGNTIYDEQTLANVFGLKEGDPYDKAEITQRLTYNMNGKDITSLYMDKGFLFFSIDAQEKRIGDRAVNLSFTIYEGVTVKIRAVVIKGNSHVSTADILKKIPIATGELFDRSKLIQAQQAIAEMGYFDPEKIQIKPLPDAKAKTGQVGGETDVEFTLVEKASKPGNTRGMNEQPSSNEKAEPYLEKVISPWYALIFGNSRKDGC